MKKFFLIKYINYILVIVMVLLFPVIASGCWGF